MSFKTLSLLLILCLPIACSGGSKTNPSKSKTIEFNHPVFGLIELEYEPHSDSEIDYVVSEKPIRISFFINNRNFPRAKELLDRVAIFIADMKRFEQLASNEIKRNLSQTGKRSNVDEHPVRAYKDHILETFNEAQLQKVFSSQDPKDISDETFLSHLKLFDIVLSPDDETEGARFYFTVSSEITYYRLVVVFDGNGEIFNLSMVS